MGDFFYIIGLTLMAGIAMPIGAALASVENIQPNWLKAEFRHSVIAFGAGALLAAIALVLVPEGSHKLNIIPAIFCFASGGLAFMALDIALDAIGSELSQLVAMLADFIPEALALGAALAFDPSAGLLLAAIMAMQNLPEGFNAYRELAEATGYSARTIIMAFAAMALLGPVAGLIGFYWLAELDTLVGGIMLFAAGGVLYLIFQDIAPQVKLERRWAPPLGAVLGFMLGLAGHMILLSHSA